MQQCTENPADAPRLRGCFVYIISTKLMTTASKSQMCGHIRTIVSCIYNAPPLLKKRRHGNPTTPAAARQGNTAVQSVQSGKFSKLKFSKLRAQNK